MEELTALKEHIEAENYREALLLIDELEAMSKEDKLQKIRSYFTIMLVHFIKQAAEQRTHPFAGLFHSQRGPRDQVRETSAENPGDTMPPRRNCGSWWKKPTRRPSTRLRWKLLKECIRSKNWRPASRWPW